MSCIPEIQLIANLAIRTMLEAQQDSTFDGMCHVLQELNVTSDFREDLAHECLVPSKLLDHRN